MRIFHPNLRHFPVLIKNLIYVATNSVVKIVSSSLYLESVEIRGALNQILACTADFVFLFNLNILYLFLMYTTAVYFKTMLLVLLFASHQFVPFKNKIVLTNPRKHVVSSVQGADVKAEG